MIPSDVRPQSLQSKPLAEARKALKLLYESKQAASPDQITFEKFYPLDLNQLAQILGWELDFVDMAGITERLEAIDAYADFAEKKITVAWSDKVPKGRLNFSIAHEIGHVILHGEEGVRLLRRTRPFREKRGARQSSSYEVEADRFAAELLMPSRAVLHHFMELFQCREIVAGSSLSETITRYSCPKAGPQERIDKQCLATSLATFTSDPSKPSLSAFFGVSVGAMARRLVELRLVID